METQDRYTRADRAMIEYGTKSVKSFVTLPPGNPAPTDCIALCKDSSPKQHTPLVARRADSHVNICVCVEPKDSISMIFQNSGGLLM